MGKAEHQTFSPSIPIILILLMIHIKPNFVVFVGDNHQDHKLAESRGCFEKAQDSAKENHVADIT